jgi:hypothetical protein
LLAVRSFAYGAPVLNGAVYLFEHAGGVWKKVARLQEPVAYSTGGFGMSIAIDGAARRVALGNFQDSRIAYSQGAVSIFRKGSAGWAFESVLLPSTPCVSAYFGRAVSINAAGDRVWGGAPLYMGSSGIRHGEVLEFERGTNGWQASGVYFSPNQPEAGGFGGALCADPTGRRLAISEASSSVHGTNAGLVHVFESPCNSPVVYCTAKTNSLGCVPQIGWQGVPSASSPSGFTVSVANTRNRHDGILFYGANGSNAAPWLGGTLCVRAPLHRTPLQNSGGTPLPLNDCSGNFTFDFNAWTASGVDASLFAGQHVRAQYYSRDPGSSAQVNVTDALDFRLEP